MAHAHSFTPGSLPDGRERGGAPPRGGAGASTSASALPPRFTEAE